MLAGTMFSGQCIILVYGHEAEPGDRNQLCHRRATFIERPTRNPPKDSPHALPMYPQFMPVRHGSCYRLGAYKKGNSCANQRKARPRIRTANVKISNMKLNLFTYAIPDSTVSMYYVCFNVLTFEALNVACCDGNSCYGLIV
jgi:hypothetical protein